MSATSYAAAAPQATREPRILKFERTNNPRCKRR
ncbi:alanine racemase [Burkholderia thailandensis]|nr:alanine racemase [Burkholderia thailandensis]AVR07960.1 alanine racemase [Burkholderia thailandensis]AWY60694.1 alanine racemase [Burkholderia thailandensis]AWY64743.1 alanine racemase [Burkholderia thailandensis]KVG17114.1 alanine racemase [Burkholderia thailandensis]